MFDITVLTDHRYIAPQPNDAYSANVFLEDDLVVKALKNVGLNTQRLAWDDPSFDWSKTRFALFRTVWDYFDRFEEFQIWFERTAKLTQFINSKSLVEWNMNKYYLSDLNAKGVHIAPTLFLKTGYGQNLEKAMVDAHKNGIASDQLVLKPCVAGAARHTYRFHHHDWEKYNNIFQELIAKESMMLQEFQHNIVSQGEISLMVFDGQFTHAVLKKAKHGDFRVQDDWGGTVHEYQPKQTEIDFALRTVDQCPERPIYARVDIFTDNHDKLALAELEIFEPELWFRKYPEATETLARAILNNYFV